MRILFLTNFYPPYELGGYEQWCAEVAAGLKARGHELSILTSNYRSGTDPDASIHRSLFLQSDINYYSPKHFLFQRKYEDQENLRTLKKLIGEFAPDVLLVWGMWNLSLDLLVWAEKWMPGRVAYYISSYWPADEDPHTAYWKLPARKSMAELLKRPMRKYALAKLKGEGYPPKPKLEHAVCCSEFVRTTLVDAGRLPAAASVLLGGIDPLPFKDCSHRLEFKQDGPLRLLYFGRLIYDKGVHTAIEALGLLKAQGKIDGLELVILGNGHPDYVAKMNQLVAELGLQPYVQFQKQIPRAAVPEFLGNFDVYLFTSIWAEPMARSVMEAMAAGLLVIGSEVGGQKEMLLNGQNALTFAAGDARQLAARLVQVIDHPAQRLQLAREGQRTVLEKFTLERMVQEIEQFLLQVSA